jgi:hypothetical protein
LISWKNPRLEKNKNRTRKCEKSRVEGWDGFCPKRMRIYTDLAGSFSLGLRERYRRSQVSCKFQKHCVGAPNSADLANSLAIDPCLVSRGCVYQRRSISRRRFGWSLADERRKLFVGWLRLRVHIKSV